MAMAMAPPPPSLPLPLLDLIRNIAGPPLPSSPIKGLCCARGRGVCSSVPALLSESKGIWRKRNDPTHSPVFLLSVEVLSQHGRPGKGVMMHFHSKVFSAPAGGVNSPEVLSPWQDERQRRGRDADATRPSFSIRRGCRLRGGGGGRAAQVVFAVREHRKRRGREADARHSLTQSLSLIHNSALLRKILCVHDSTWAMAS